MSTTATVGFSIESLAAFQAIADREGQAVERVITSWLELAQLVSQAREEGYALVLAKPGNYHNARVLWGAGNGAKETGSAER